MLEDWMYILFFLCTGLILSVLGIIVLRHYAGRLGLVDPPGTRKDHKSPTPLVGGIAIYLALVYCWILLHFLAGVTLFATEPFFLIGLTLILIEGLWDDQKNRTALNRIIIHIFIVLIMVEWTNTGLYDLGNLLGNTILYTGIWMVPLTVFAASGGINAFNMIDGIDGLAGNIALVPIIAMLGLTLYNERLPEAYFLATMAGALVGFLLYNLRTPWRKQASVFLGDSGSMVIGLAIVWFMTHLSQGEGRVLQPVMALWFFAVPLFDAVSLIIRRTVDSRSPLGADRKHIHHMFLAMGFTVSQTVIILTGVSILFTLTAIYASVLGVPGHYMFYTFLVLFGLYLYGTRIYWRTSKVVIVNLDSRGIE